MFFKLGNLIKIGPHNVLCLKVKNKTQIKMPIFTKLLLAPLFDINNKLFGN